MFSTGRSLPQYWPLEIGYGREKTKNPPEVYKHCRFQCADRCTAPYWPVETNWYFFAALLSTNAGQSHHNPIASFIFHGMNTVRSR